MPLSRSRDYLSIGEVIETIKPDFPDISISKIRFLEGEGLITPERTASGYRKFYEPQIERLRYILALQRDQFLPLKVIRARLQEADDGGGYPAVASSTGDARASSGVDDKPAAGASVALTTVQLSRGELVQAAGLTAEQLAGLEDFGLVRPGEGGLYDENDLVTAKSARRLFQYGAEPRHLRMYRQIAEREASFFEQIVMPMTMRRDPRGHEEATQTVQDMLTVSRRLKEAQLSVALRGLL
ncbi:MerR family transcriptional regulator [soil metagenome]